MKAIIISIVIIIGIAATAIYNPIVTDSTLTGDGSSDSPLSVSSSFSSTNALLAGRAGGQTLIGGTATTDDLILQSTSGVGATGALIQFKVGNNGGTTAATILNNANFGIGTTNPGYLFEVQSAAPVISINDTDGTNRGFNGAYFQTAGSTDYFTVSINRDPATGVFANTGRAASQINFESNNGDADIVFYTHTTNNTNPLERLRIDGAGTSVFSAPLRLKAYTVGTLPSGTTGDMAYVTDATAPTYLGTLTGGGAVVCPVFYNGSAWVSH